MQSSAVTPQIEPTDIDTGLFYAGPITTEDGTTVCVGEHLDVNNGEDIGIPHKISVVVYHGKGGIIGTAGRGSGMGCWLFPSDAQGDVNTFIQQNASEWIKDLYGFCASDYHPCTDINVVNYP